MTDRMIVMILGILQNSARMKLGSSGRLIVTLKISYSLVINANNSPKRFTYHKGVEMDWN